MLINPGISPQPSEDACKSPNLVINRELSLKDGIVKTEAEVNTSSYLVSEDWASKAIFYAVMQGETIRVTKPK